MSLSHPSGIVSLIFHRYSTKFEITINVIGVVCAAAAGAAQVSPLDSQYRKPHRLWINHQPLMSLLFGNLTQDFVNFSLAENSYAAALQSGNSTAISQAQQMLDASAVAFRQSAALSASYLTYIGEFFVLSLNHY